MSEIRVSFSGVGGALPGLEIDCTSSKHMAPLELFSKRYLSAHAFVRALGLVDTGGAASAARRFLIASMGQSKTHEQHDQKHDWNNKFFH